MSEWLKEHAWKACVSQKGTVGSNPTLSAKIFQKNRNANIVLKQSQEFSKKLPTVLKINIPLLSPIPPPSHHSHSPTSQSSPEFHPDASIATAHSGLHNS